MVRQGNWKLITCRTDPDQLYNLADDPREHTNLANDAAHANTLRKLKAMAAARWNPAQLEADIRESQLVRLTVWHALREGKWYPWDYQPLRDASEQYMRNHKDLNVLEKTSRFPPPAQPEKKSG
jgi:choline-sulfatase